MWYLSGAISKRQEGARADGADKLVRPSHACQPPGGGERLGPPMIADGLLHARENHDGPRGQNFWECAYARQGKTQGRVRPIYWPNVVDPERGAELRSHAQGFCGAREIEQHGPRQDHEVDIRAELLVALDVARHLVVYFRRNADDPQLSPWLLHRNHIDRRVHDAQDLVVRDPRNRWTIPELARRVHTSPRHLNRLFHVYAGIAPLAYVRKIRAASARQLLQQPGASVEGVAEQAGFHSADQLRRAFRKFEQRRPSDVRPHSAASGAGAPRAR